MNVVSKLILGLQPRLAIEFPDFSTERQMKTSHAMKITCKECSVISITRNIVSNPKELSILELPLPFVEPHSVYPMVNEAHQPDDDFMKV
ncbi:hypothetical protein HAX54_030632 [Datura stramonium]|uniref:Uncharacterized protein n=1 Tax=Datura stramonium TaxID=4076 RepID=A0ABS8VBE6_DATST|nr:hypothetical protein [Datura stramonium]